MGSNRYRPSKVRYPNRTGPGTPPSGGRAGTGWDSWHRDRMAELPEDWYRAGGIRDQVIERDKGVCQWRSKGVLVCLAPGTVVDHIADPHDHTLRNLRLLCTRHDRQRTSQQGVDAARRARQRPAERHPFHRLADG